MAVAPLAPILPKAVSGWMLKDRWLVEFSFVVVRSKEVPHLPLPGFCPGEVKLGRIHAELIQGHHRARWLMEVPEVKG
jgi:hypothetical protein